MKKLVLMLAVAVTALCSQAATVKWATGAVTDENGNAFTSSTTGYTLTVMLWDATGATLLESSSSSTWNAVGQVEETTVPLVAVARTVATWVPAASCSCENVAVYVAGSEASEVVIATSVSPTMQTIDAGAFSDASTV